MPRIIGLGAGRCGTKSLASLLSRQSGAHVTHQRYRLKWGGDNANAMALVRSIMDSPHGIVGDVAFYWLPYVEEIRRAYLFRFDCPELKFICLYRPREEYIESWCQSLPTIRLNSDDPLAQAYPVLGISDPEKAAGIYHDMYYSAVEALGIKTFPVEALNSEQGQRSILEYLGIANPVIVPGGVRENQR